MKPLALFLALLLLAAAPAQAAKRVALLVGNASYGAGAAPLAYPAQDMQVMEAALGKLGFKVRKVLNAGQTAMKGAVSDFSQEAAGADVAFFYYSGHGTQAGGENYLIPVDAAIQSTGDYAAQALSANEVLRQLQGARPGAAIVVLDACRDNPHAPAATRGEATTRGLGRISAPTGTVVAFATAPNTTAGDNGYYAKVLARELQKGQKLSDVFLNTAEEVRKLSGGKQEPYIGEMSSVGNIYLASVAPALAPPAREPAPAAAASPRPTHAPAAPTAAGGSGGMELLLAIQRNADKTQTVALRSPKSAYKVGQDYLELEIHSSMGGYLTLLSVGSSGRIFQLFPNAVDGDNRIQANSTTQLPRPQWRVPAGGPAGKDRFLAVVSGTPDIFASLGIPVAGRFRAVDGANANAREIVERLTAPAAGCKAASSARDFDSPEINPCASGYGAGMIEVMEVD